MTVVEEVVVNDWCIGCGMCATVCPKNRLELRWNERGEYNPVVVEDDEECGENCLLCYQVCPAHGNTRNETEIGKVLYSNVEDISYTPETGYFLSSYVGYSEEHRLSSASGGLASWMLESLLESGEVDGVLAVGRTTDPDKLFEFKVCKTKEEILLCGRSAYYPVEVSQVIQQLLQRNGQYAIIGLPCVCKAIRLAQDKLPKLKKRIKYVLGLTCGHACSKFFVEYICALGGGNPCGLKEFIFRTKDLSQPASNHQMTFRSQEGAKEITRSILWQNGVGRAYLNGYFQLPGCFHCDDIFAECADAVFMDAWLPEYAKQPEGFNLVLSRDKFISDLLLGKDSVALIGISRLIESQSNVVKRKRGGVTNKIKGPSLRYRNNGFINRIINTQRYYLSKKSSACWRRNLIAFNECIASEGKCLQRILAARSWGLYLVRRILKFK